MKVTVANYLEFLNRIRQSKIEINRDKNLSLAGKDAELEKLDLEIKDAISQLNAEVNAKQSELKDKLKDMKRPGMPLPKPEDLQMQSYLGDMLLSNLMAANVSADRFIDAVNTFVSESPVHAEVFTRFYHKTAEIAKSMGEDSGALERLQTKFRDAKGSLTTPEQKSFDEKKKEMSVETNKLNATVYTARELLTREIVNNGPWKRTE